MPRSIFSSYTLILGDLQIAPCLTYEYMCCSIIYTQHGLNPKPLNGYL